MANQGADISMVGLGMVGETAPHPGLSAPRDGIHLRWAPRPERGFPWHGYYLLRRRSHGGDPICVPFPRERPTQRDGLSADGRAWKTKHGLWRSDAPLAWSDDFPAPYELEADLRDRKWLLFQPLEPARKVRLCIGFRKDVPCPSPVRVRALAGDKVTVAETLVTGNPGDVVEVDLEADRIDAIVTEGAEAALVCLCFVPLAQGLTSGWEPVPGFTYPYALPVAHTDYACPTKPATKPAAEALALGRISYGPPTPWGGPQFEALHEALSALVAGGPAAGLMWDRQTTNLTAIGDPDAPEMERQRPLALVLLAALDPAVAQMVGLYWRDETTPAGVGYDYLVLADHDNLCKHSLQTALDRVRTGSLQGIDHAIVFNKARGPAPPLPPPTELRAYGLPGAVVARQDGSLKNPDATNNAGLRWRIRGSTAGLDEGAPVAYHVWRNDVGAAPPGVPVAGAQHAPLTLGRPVLLSLPALARAPVSFAPDLPPYPMHYLDSCLRDGWYSYRLTARDLFGRHSDPGAPAAWHQWNPSPPAGSWGLGHPPGEVQFHPFAIHLQDLTAPPPPTGVEGYALDPRDPYVLVDAGHTAWRSSLPAAERETRIGLRVRWAWTDPLARQAPDAADFRVHFHPGLLNALPGNTTSVTPAGAGQSMVQTDLPNSRPANAHNGARLRIGDTAFAIVASDAGSPLRVRVQHAGTATNPVAPAAGRPCALVFPPGHALHTDFAPATAWAAHIHTVAVAAPTRTEGSASAPTRIYEATGPWPAIGPLPAIDQPTVYGHVTVTTVDRAGNESATAAPAKVFLVHRDRPSAPEPVPPDSDVQYTAPPDFHGLARTTFRWRPRLHCRTHILRGLDDTVYARSWLLRSTRRALDPQEPTHDLYFPRAWAAGRRSTAAGELNALNSLAGYAALSNDAWELLARLPGNGKVPVGDHEALKQRDWAVRRSHTGLQASDAAWFPLPDPAWTTQKRTAVANELNALVSLAELRAASNDGKRVLAALPGMEDAYTQVTLHPLPDDAGTQDRRGPDDATTYAPRPDVRAYEDAISGSAPNAYFYRAAHIDAAGNVSDLGPSTVPVVVPDLAPPASPVVVEAVGGERSTRLGWTPVASRAVKAYALYRARTPEQATDLALMEAAGQVPAQTLVAQGGHVPLAPADAVLVERVYAASGFDPDGDLLAGQVGPQYLPAPAAPAAGEVSGVTAPDGAAVVAVYRDSRGALQHTAPAGRPVRWRDAQLRGPQTYLYRVVAVRTGRDRSGPVELRSTPSTVATARAVDTSVPAPPPITTLEWVRVAPDGTVHPFATPVPAGAEWRTAARVAWTGGPDLRCMVQSRHDPAGAFRPASRWLAPGTAAFLHGNDLHTIDHEYRVIVTNAAGNLNTQQAPAPLAGVP